MKTYQQVSTSELLANDRKRMYKSPRHLGGTFCHLQLALVGDGEVPMERSGDMDASLSFLRFGSDAALCDGVKIFDAY
jgi:hypothetical protein